MHRNASTSPARALATILLAGALTTLAAAFGMGPFSVVRSPVTAAAHVPGASPHAIHASDVYSTPTAPPPQINTVVVPVPMPTPPAYPAGAYGPESSSPSTESSAPDTEVTSAPRDHCDDDCGGASGGGASTMGGGDD